jgi:hypothetical protein
MLDVAAQNHLGSLFIGDGAAENPYDRLPAYWARAIRRMREVLDNPQPANPHQTDAR